MKFEKFVMPLMVFAAVITVWLLFRNSGTSATSSQPNASASGVPGYAPQAQQFAVNPAQYTPSPLVMMADPYSQDPQGNALPRLPQYLSFNFGPSHDLTKTPPVLVDKKAGGCGGSCCGGCSQENSCDQNSKNNFPDGSGSTAMATTTKRQIERAPQDWFEVAYQNFVGTQTVEVQPQPTQGNQAPAAPASNIPGSTPHSQTQLVYTGPHSANESSFNIGG